MTGRASQPGELLETAVGRVEAFARRSAADRGMKDGLAALEHYCDGLFAAGITYVCDPGVDAMLEGYLRRASGRGVCRCPSRCSLSVVRGSFSRRPIASMAR